MVKTEIARASPPPIIAPEVKPIVRRGKIIPRGKSAGKRARPNHSLYHQTIPSSEATLIETPRTSPTSQAPNVNLNVTVPKARCWLVKCQKTVDLPRYVSLGVCWLVLAATTSSRPLTGSLVACHHRQPDKFGRAITSRGTAPSNR